jgi:hypothetical protein
MPHGEDPPVNAVQTASANPAQAAALANADACELLESDDAVLACCDPGDRGVLIIVGAFPTHVGG